MNAVKNKIPPLVKEELTVANAMYPQFHSRHEGYAVMLEEVEEVKSCLDDIENRMKILWNMIKNDREALPIVTQLKKCKTISCDLACEAIQVAAMAQKTLDYLEGESDD